MADADAEAAAPAPDVVAPHDPPPLRPLVNEDHDDEVVDDILYDLLADAEAYVAGLEVGPCLCC